MKPLDPNRTMTIKTRLIVSWHRECRRLARELSRGDVDAAKGRLGALMGLIAHELKEDDIEVVTE